MAAYSPYFSLLSGAISAYFMDRSPRAVVVVIPAAIAVWAVMAGMVVLSRVEPEGLSPRMQTLVRLAQGSLLVVAQSVVQQCLYFALPFYIRAAAFTPSHILFLVLLGATSLATLWDPLWERMMRRRGSQLFVFALGNFAACNAILPTVGFSNALSLLLSALVAALGVPAQVALDQPRGARLSRPVQVAFAVALGLSLVVVFGLARGIPPAPLKLVDGAIGTRMAGKAVADPSTHFASPPTEMVCATSISAPRGLNDRLLHVWRKDGRVMDRIPLEVRGGRVEGFRTWSAKRTLGKRPKGRWTCSVETAAGQLLGSRTVVIESNAGAPTDQGRSADAAAAPEPPTADVEEPGDEMPRPPGDGVDAGPNP